MKVKVVDQSFISISQVVKLGGLGIAGALYSVWRLRLWSHLLRVTVAPATLSVGLAAAR